MVLKILYWIAVLVVSLALLVALVVFFESRDDSSLDERAAVRGASGVVGAPAPALER